MVREIFGPEYLPYRQEKQMKTYFPEKGAYAPLFFSLVSSGGWDSFFGIKFLFFNLSEQ